MLPRAILIACDTTVGDLRLQLGRLMGSRMLVIEHARLESPAYFAFEPSRLEWLLSTALDDDFVVDALELEASEPLPVCQMRDALETLRYDSPTTVLLDGSEVVGVEIAHVPSRIGSAMGPSHARSRAVEVAPGDSITPADPTAPTYVNFSFYEIKFRSLRELGINEGFYGGSSYRLSVGIGLTADPRFGGDGTQPPIQHPSDEARELHVALFVRKGPLRIPTNSSRLRRLTWSGGATEETAEFKLEVDDVSDLQEAGIDIFIYYETNVIYVGRFRIEIAPEQHAWSVHGRPIRWDYTKDEDHVRSKLFRRFADLGVLTERGLSLVVQRGQADDQYILTGFIGRAELLARVDITREEMSDFTVKSREMMDLLRRNPLYVLGGYDKNGNYTGTLIGDAVYDRSGNVISQGNAREAFRKFLNDMAVLGSHAYDRLFRSEDGQILREALEKHLQPGETIQIAIHSGASDFIWPWAWLYRKFIDPSHRFEADPKLFWGYQYVIEQIANFEASDGDGLVTSEIDVKPLKVQIGVWNFEPETKSQEKYFKDLSASRPGDIAYTVWDDDKSWEEFLPRCDSQLLYFFSHGHTAKPKGLTGSSDYNMLASWQKWLKDLPSDESEAMKAYRTKALAEIQELEETQLLDESFIRLRRGMLLLGELYQLTNLSNSNPLVFLNMCESAQVLPALKGSLIDVFLSKGARAVMGTEIPMITSFADLISREFFDALLSSDKPARIGDILFHLRRKHLDNGNPLAFAYTIFGDAMVSVAHSTPPHETRQQPLRTIL